MAYSMHHELGINWELVDERQDGSPMELTFTGQLRADQEAAVEAMLRHDIGVMQSLVRKGEVNPLVQGYGQVIVDECHHIAAASFETLLRQVKARHVLGLSATLVRRDGLQPILFLQCGPIRHAAQRPAGAPQTLELVSRTHQLPALPTESGG